MILERTLEKPGTVAVGEFSTDGRAGAHLASEKLPDDFATITSQFAATVRMYSSTMGASFSHVSALPLVPFQSFVYGGGDMASIVRQDHWAILRAAESEFAPVAGDEPLGLEELLHLSGVRLASYYAPDGAVIACKQTAGFSREVLATTTKLVSATTAACQGLATAFTHLSPAIWSPLKVWQYAGGDWALSVSPTCWILAEAGEADLPGLHRSLLR